jgi:N-succinyl-L-ornithine transcarbamylase
VVLTWAPHVKALPQCVANSFAQWATAANFADVVVTHPAGYELSASYTKGATITHDQAAALEGADFVYVKNWSSYNDYGKVFSTDPAWMLTANTLKHSNNAKVMHCLPVRRNVELSDEILDSSSSLVTKQAGNRVWAAQAVLSTILSSKK